MLTVLAKWKLAYHFQINETEVETVTLYISDNYLSNVLRKAIDIGFELEPFYMEVERI